MIQTVLGREPQNRDARLALAEYHLRSHHWSEASATYGALVAESPVLLEALLGLHEVANQTGDWPPALAAWDRAFRRDPGNRVFQSFYAWAAACAGLPTADEVADALLEIDPKNPLGAGAKMLVTMRAGDIGAAVEWVEKTRDALGAGEFVPFARPLDRSLATVRVLRARGALPVDAAIIEAAVDSARGDAAAARELLATYLREQPAGKWRQLAEKLQATLR